MYPWNLPAPRKSDRPRALLDTNVWRYVVDIGAAGELLQNADNGAFDIQISPAVVYETLRLKDTSLRDSLIRLMTNSRFKRLMPEAYSESMEILHEIECAHPAWLRTSPDLTFFNRLRNDWRKRTGGFWVRLARSPSEAARYLRQRGDTERVELGRELATFLRSEMQQKGWKQNPPMDKSTAGFIRPRPGWRGDMVESWRIDSWLAISWSLTQPGDAYRDWIAPFIQCDRGLTNSASWLEFWLYEARKEVMPRQWMRWAYSFSQRFRKVTRGSPGDTQLAMYFLETDLVISADKALLDILNECRPYAPCPLPKGMLIVAGKEGVPEMLKLLKG